VNYRYQIQGRYFLVALFFLNIMALLLIRFTIPDPAPDGNAVLAEIVGFMTLNVAGMSWCLRTVRPKSLPTTTGSRTCHPRKRLNREAPKVTATLPVPPKSSGILITTG
jgi:uncharacterized membrane protein YqjE